MLLVKWHFKMLNQNAYFFNDSNQCLRKLNKKTDKSWFCETETGTILGLELLEEVPDLDYIIVPISGKKQYILNKYSKNIYGKYFFICENLFYLLSFEVYKLIVLRKR